MPRLAVSLALLAGLGSCFVSPTPALAQAPAREKAKAAEDPRIASLRRAAEACGKAAIDNDWEKLVDYTHPKAVNTVGGRKPFIFLTKMTMKRLKDDGIEFKSFKLGEMTKPIKEGENLFSIVSKDVVLTIPGGKLLATSYMVGISSDDGKTWTFVDGNGLEDPKARPRLLPKYPAELKFPEIPEPTTIDEK